MTTISHSTALVSTEESRSNHIDHCRFRISGIHSVCNLLLPLLKIESNAIVLPNRHSLQVSHCQQNLFVKIKRIDPRSQGIKNTFNRYRSFHLPFGQSPVNSELERSVYSLHLWVSDNGSSVVNNRLKVQMPPGRILTNKDEKKNQDNVKNDSFEIIPSESGEKDNGVNEEKNDENK